MTERTIVEFDAHRQKLRSSATEDLKTAVAGTTLKTSPLRFQKAVDQSLGGFDGNPEVETYKRQLMAGASYVQREVNIAGGEEFPAALARIMAITLEEMQRQYTPQLLRGNSPQALRARTQLLGARLFVAFITAVQADRAR